MLRFPGPLQNLVQVQRWSEDIRAKVREIVLDHLLSSQLDDRSVEENRHGVLVLQYDLRQVRWSAPRFSI